MARAGNEGILPRWTLKRGGVIAPDERLPWGQTLFVGLQHIFAMFGATVLVPILMGFDPNTAIFFSGIGTLLFFVVTGGRLPSYLGSSFSFIAVVIAATGYAGSGPNANIGVALGGIVAAGVLYALIALVVKAVAAMTGQNLDPYLGRAFLGDGVATIVAGFGGGTGVTTYAENIGVMAVTKIYSPLVFVVGPI